MNKYLYLLLLPLLLAACEHRPYTNIHLHPAYMDLRFYLNDSYLHVPDSEAHYIGKGPGNITYTFKYRHDSNRQLHIVYEFPASIPFHPREFFTLEKEYEMNKEELENQGAGTRSSIYFQRINGTRVVRYTCEMDMGEKYNNHLYRGDMLIALEKKIGRIRFYHTNLHYNPSDSLAYTHMVDSMYQSIVLQSK